MHRVVQAAYCHLVIAQRRAGRSVTHPARLSTCCFCASPIALSRWSGWVEAVPRGSHDMCPGEASATHEPIEDLRAHPAMPALT